MTFPSRYKTRNNNIVTLTTQTDKGIMGEIQSNDSILYVTYDLNLNSREYSQLDCIEWLRPHPYGKD